MRFTVMAIMLVLIAGNAFASDTPKWSNETNYSSHEKCLKARKQWEESVKEEKGMTCRNVLGVVIACDNILEHVEFGCRGDKKNILWIEVFDQ